MNMLALVTNIYEVYNNGLENISIMIMVKAKEDYQELIARPWLTGPPYVAFETRDRRE